MDPELKLERFAECLRERILASWTLDFNQLALELFALQFELNRPYRRSADAKGISPGTVKDWWEIPAAPTAGFKEWELSCIPAPKRTSVFFSSGTTEHRLSRHFHHNRSLELYEASLLSWFTAQVLEKACPLLQADTGQATVHTSLPQVVSLTPPPGRAPHSSLAHMFGTLRRKLPFNEFSFVGEVTSDGSWTLDYSQALSRLREAVTRQEPIIILGTAFSYVHLLDYLAQHNQALQLPVGSKVLETGGYKGRSRSLPKKDLHALISDRLGVGEDALVCEYGMSELSSQAYEKAAMNRGLGSGERIFHFPPWARVQVISPETGEEVAEGEMGLVRVYDLANVYSVQAIQTEDLAIKKREGFELIGRAQQAEARGCSLMAQ